MSDWVGIFIILISLFCGGFALGIKCGEPMLDSSKVLSSVESVIHCKDCSFGHLRQEIINGYEDTWIECVNPDGLNRDVSIEGYCSAGVRKEQENGRERKGND